MGWTQPICASCWTQRNPDREPTRVIDDELQTCAFCGRSTQLGIYVRADPTTVPYPST